MNTLSPPLAAEIDESLIGLKPEGYWQGVMKRLRRDPVTIGAASIVAIILLAALFADLLPLADPHKGSIINRLKPIGTENYLLGADELGRDMLSRLIYGGRMSLLMGLAPVVAAFLIGGTLGIIAGYLGGKANMAIMRVIDVFYAFPSILLAIAISGALGAGLINTLISLTVVFIPPLARIAESVTTSVRNLDFVDAARACGASSFQVIRTHVLGNVIGPIFIYATSLVSVSMILAAGLSFIGLGVKPPEPEWGLMLNTLRTAIYVDPLIAALPGFMIFIISICFNLMSDGLRSAMDVKH